MTSSVTDRPSVSSTPMEREKKIYKNCQNEKQQKNSILFVQYSKFEHKYFFPV